jgi:fluoride ion exporter CrcB/FEX
MQPELMRELVTIEAFEAWLRGLTVVGVIGSIVGGLLWARRQVHPRRWQLGVLTGALIATLFPLLYGLWRFYLWRIRIDLERDFVGLHQVDVLLGNIVIFALAGAIVGVIARFYTNWLKRQLTQEERNS